MNFCNLMTERLTEVAGWDIYRQSDEDLGRHRASEDPVGDSNERRDSHDSESGPDSEEIELKMEEGPCQTRQIYGIARPRGLPSPYIRARRCH
jgi:hypothetical protein